MILAPSVLPTHVVMDVELSIVRNPSRVKTPVSSPLPSISLSHVHVTDALKRSPDDGVSLDFARQNISDVGESAVQELTSVGRKDIDDESSVLRIALGSNRLTTLPTGFALLSRLRYLNLKSNNFTIFPEVLTVMPSLDTLDIGHNKIKRLPSQPGSLVNLRVFNFSRNKLIRVPSYFSKLRKLEILKLDRNPIEWPPKSVMEPPHGVNTPQEMIDWINLLQKWLESNAFKTEFMSAQSPAPNDLNGWENNVERRSSWQTFQINGGVPRVHVIPHSRSFSRDSNFSVSSIGDSVLESQPSTSSLLDRPHLAHLSSTRSRSASPSPSRITDSYLPSPEESPDHEMFAAVSELIHQRRQQVHSRNTSLNVQDHSPTKTDLSEKMSMPDLRTARINFSRKVPDVQERETPNTRRPPHLNKSTEEFSMPSPLSQQHDSGSPEESSLYIPSKPFARDPIVDSPTSDQPAPAMDGERNSYFRRFSALTATSTTLPEPLVHLVDAARSILFAVSQVYQVLRHYTVFVIDERLASVLRKVLDPASADMTTLIGSLDRFDSASRKSVPPPRICRAVVESCRNTVSAFGKAVGVLSLQLKVLASRDDIRYVRLMLLTLYGALAEISYSWQSMLPHIEAVRPSITENRRPVLLKVQPPASPTPTASESGHTYFRHQVERPSLSRTHSDDPPSGLGIGRTRTARRHAGSFSSKDVEIGKTLPSYEPVPLLPAGLALNSAKTAALRVPRRQFSSPNPAISVPSSAPATSYPFGSLSSSTGAAGRIGKLPPSPHSRQGSQPSLHTSSAPPSSPSIAVPRRPAHLDIPHSSNSRNLVDKEALDAMKSAVEAAPAVWEMSAEILADVMETNEDIRENLSLAKVVTKRLKESIIAVQSGDSIVDKRSLREDAHLFVKTVVQLSNAIKTYGASNAVSSSLRNKMVTLTNSTEEFVILLHVSSFSPAPTAKTFPPAYSPSLAGQRSPLAWSSPMSAGGPEDSRLGASISRNRSAMLGSSLKLAMPPPRSGPLSALPYQSIPAPPTPVSRLPEETRDWL